MTETFNTVHPGLGCKVAYSTSSSFSSPVTVGQLKSIGGTSFESVMADSTGINSAAAEQVAVGLFKGGDYEFTVNLNMSDTSHQALLGYLGTTTVLYWIHTFSLAEGPGATSTTTGATYKFAGYLAGFSTTGYEAESILEATIKVGITGLNTPTNPS